MKHLETAEYIWIDGNQPVQNLRSKTKIVNLPEDPNIADFPLCRFDGSSTNQADINSSDCVLHPVNFVHNPLEGEDGYLVLCEVFHANHTAHPTNNRRKLREILSKSAEHFDPWIGFEQEYIILENNNPVGWPDNGFPAPQGPYYCGVGTNTVAGRNIAKLHQELCLKSGILYSGMNAEVMLGQWEFQVGYRYNEKENVNPINVSDHLWMARWLLYRISEDFNLRISIENKLIKGNWNGSGMHANLSTKDMRKIDTSTKALDDAINLLSKKHELHISLYGNKLEERLTGSNETSSMNDFTSNTGDRSSSIRIPSKLSNNNVVRYIEDRRPGANSDPYLVSAILLSTICSIDWIEH
ncbi:glutamine synthetase beta-grasp domain-containing protein [Rickettsia endosymbiont of Cardiosporidium cionae]|uniref:glutamine synthetase beta-grasp domain-containing protein n=1 Tax=Rickettsia endosymbiont of Cardiosporidium cionae TaxID=2777155 RepID=UPI001892FDAD|nr:glutamine synthetase beta-grasp domain-containing protein [Rickettsia endosymbiont of Cardiosporidium cionae]KAF8818290.1 Glutamine synthetase [Rickettsia endosymbiont of Cardiosporidium cionae]